MVMLIRKMLRDVWKNKVPFIAIFLMMFAGNFIFSGITSEYNGMQKSFSSYIHETNLADAWVVGNNFSHDDVEELEKKSNIDDVEYRVSIQSTLTEYENKFLDLYALDKENNISQIKVIKGAKYSWKNNGIWLDTIFAKENNYGLGDKIKLSINGQEIEREIVGLCYSPEYIYNTKNGELVTDHKNTGFAFVSKSSMNKFEDLQSNQLLIKGNGNLTKTVEDTLKNKNTTVILQKDHMSYSMISDEITQHKEIGLIFVGVFLFIAILITITTVHRLLNSQRLQIGILKALGFKKRNLYIHYTSHSTFVCLIGSCLGWLTGYFALSNILHPIMREMYILPELKSSMLEWSWMLPIICMVLCLLISVIVCQKYLRGNASKILYSNSVEKKYKEIPLSFIWKHFSFYGQWNLRDIFRNKLRSVMTVLGVVGCVALIYSSLGLFTSMQHLSDWTFDDVLTYETKVTGNFSNQEFKNKLITSMYGEELMEKSIDIKFKDEEKSVAFTGVETQDYIKAFDIENNSIELKKGIAISKNIADEIGIKIGDRLKWRFMGQNKWYLSSVKYIIRTPMSQGITMLKSEMDKENIPFIATSIIGEKPDEIDTNSEFINSIQYKEDLKEGLNTVLNASVMISTLFLVMAILLGSVILYNLGTLSYMERYRDMATLKVLGFNNKRIRKLMVQQNLWLTFVGVVVGLPAGYGLMVAMLGTVQTSIDISVYTPLYVYIASLLGTFLLSWLINKILAGKIKYIDMVSALKVNE